MQESDRELLELAARAAGVEIVRWNNSGCVPLIALKMGDLTYDVKAWNPLADDGDALRLAVMAGIWIHPGEQDEYVKAVGVSAVYEPPGNAREAATRRAIVRAAAAIKRNMP